MNRPFHGVPGSCGEEMRMRQASPPRRLPPSCTSSSRWTWACPLPQWMIREKRWIGNFKSATRTLKSSGGVLWSTRCRSIKDYRRGRVLDLQLRWAAIRRAVNAVSYAPSGLWSVRVRESEKVFMEALGVIGEVQRYWEALYAQRRMNLPAFERLV